MNFPNPKNFISINHYGRSGSYLLSNLLDSHPEVLSVPPHSLPKFFRSFFSTFPESRIARLTLTDLMYFIDRECKYLFIENGKLHPFIFHYSDMKFGVTKNDFMQKIGEILKSKIQEINQDKIDIYELATVTFISIHLAYHLSLNRKLPRKYVIAFQAHNSPSLNFYQEFQPFFEKITILRSVRYPEKTFDSLLARSIKMDVINVDDSDFRKYCANILQIPTLRLKQFIRDERLRGIDLLNYHAVRFEDLHLNTKKIMQAVSREIGISWNDCLLKTTCDGMPFYMESKDGEYITGTNPATVNNLNYSVLNDKERYNFSFAMRASYRAYGYRLRPAPKYLGFENFFVPTTAHKICMRKIFEKYGVNGRKLSSTDMRWAFKYMLLTSRDYGRILVERHNEMGFNFPTLISPYDHIEKFPFQ